MGTSSLEFEYSKVLTSQIEKLIESIKNPVDEKSLQKMKLGISEGQRMREVRHLLLSHVIAQMLEGIKFSDAKLILACAGYKVDLAQKDLINSHRCGETLRNV